MRSESEIEDAYEKAARVAENLDEQNPFEAIAPIIVTRTLRWVVEEETDDEGDLFEEIDDFIEDLENE
jgi:hypothetical protein